MPIGVRNLDILKRNNVVIKGTGKRVLLFAHGYGCDQNMWRYITPAFVDQFKVVLFDHVGSGKSDWNSYNKQKYSTLQSYAEDIIEICETQHLENVILIAHSVSTMIALLAGKIKPSLFSKIVMIGPSPRYINDSEYFGGFSESDIQEMIETLDSNFLGWSSAITPVIMGNEDKPELAEELKESFCRHDPDIAKHFAHVTFLGDNRTDLPDLKVKTLIIQASQDVIAPLKVGEYVQKKIPNAELKVVEATGHCLHMSHPKETIQIINDFIR
jgi:sigma-B regulation protein RsbQ